MVAFVTVNGPLRKRCTSGRVETDDLAGRYNRDVFVIARPGEGVVERGDFDWDVDNKIAVTTVVDPNKCTDLADTRLSGRHR